MLKTNNILALLVTIIVTSLSLTGFAQKNNITSSPYSRYGLGTLSNYSFGRTEAMGGIGIGTRYGYQINSANPASYTAIDSMTFLMEFGVNSRHTNYKTETGNSASNDANFNYLAVSFPITKWWASAITLAPYSNVGYGIETSQEIIQNGDTTNSYMNYSGNGTLSKLIFGNSFDLNENLSVGINAWYLFGELNDISYQAFSQSEDSYDLREDVSKSLNDFGFTLGLQYQVETEKNNKLIFGAVFEPSKDFSSSYSLFQRRNLTLDGGTVVDTINNVSLDNVKTKLPLSYGAGVSYEIKNKLTVGADYYHQNWSKASLQGVTPEYFSDLNRYSAGMEYVPNSLSLRSYWKKIHYRMGMFYENSYLTLNGTQIKNRGITFGLGLPLKQSKSSLNISAELGKTGTTSNNLIEESYAKFSLQILLHDRWFFKRKID
jgi:hypothetical protein